MIKVVLFDFGGVLAESGRSGFIAESIAEVYGVPVDQLDIRRDHYLLRRGRGDETALFDRLNKQFGKKVTKQMYLDKAHGMFKTSQEVYDLAERLRRHGIRTGILSNIFAMDAEVLREQGQYDGFDPVILSCDEGYAKPELKFYDIAIKKLGVAPEEILFVDDQQKCIGPAERLGMATVTALDPGQIVRDVTKIVESQNHIALQ
jgi:epoxide hydrolase-like predicted phosphatase